MLTHLEEVLREAQSKDCEVSIGIEAIEWGKDLDLPVGGYLYADCSFNEGNMGIYRNINWLIELIEDYKIYKSYMS